MAEERRKAADAIAAKSADGPGPTPAPAEEPAVAPAPEPKPGPALAEDLVRIRNPPKVETMVQPPGPGVEDPLGNVSLKGLPNPSVASGMILQGVDMLHDDLYRGTGYPGWLLTEKQKEFWKVLTDYIAANLPLRYLPIIIAGALIAYIEGQKFVGWRKWEAAKAPGPSPAKG